MGGYRIQIEKAEASPRAVDPGDVIFRHHRAGHAHVRIEMLTGAHLLHLAVAGCLFNDILRVAAERGITINQLEVSADGDFDGEPAVSTGISYSVRIAGEASEDELRGLVRDCEQETSIGNTLQRSTPVLAAAVHVDSIA
jgi:organic hydroperoxide reductase OsmC/OhrA